MKLTKQQAIEGHRKMWNWIADKIEKEKGTFHISELKKTYCNTNNLFLRHNCFCCEYSRVKYCKVTDDICCERCPIDWVETDDCITEEKSLYNRVLCAPTWQEQADLARLIAYLPEKGRY